MTLARTHFVVLAVALGLPTVLLGQSDSALRAPRWFASAWTGVQWGRLHVTDDASNSRWDFDAAFTMRGTLEREIRPRLALGVAWSQSRPPLTYQSLTAGACGACAADATMTSYGLTVRYGGGRRFYQLYEAFVGVMNFRNFERVSPRGPLEPRRGSTDPALGLGVGVGYAIAEDWHVVLIQDNVTVMHERSVQPFAGGRFARSYATRLGLRVGF